MAGLNWCGAYLSRSCPPIRPWLRRTVHPRGRLRHLGGSARRPLLRIDRHRDRARRARPLISDRERPVHAFARTEGSRRGIGILAFACVLLHWFATYTVADTTLPWPAGVALAVTPILIGAVLIPRMSTTDPYGTDGVRAVAGLIMFFVPLDILVGLTGGRYDLIVSAIATAFAVPYLRRRLLARARDPDVIRAERGLRIIGKHPIQRGHSGATLGALATVEGQGWPTNVRCATTEVSCPSGIANDRVGRRAPVDRRARHGGWCRADRFLLVSSARGPVPG